MRPALLLAILANIRAAGREGGVWLALIVAAAALFLAWLAFNPVEEVADHVVAPVGRSVGVLASRCPGGWDDLSERVGDAEVFICARANWRVILKPDGKTFDHAVELNRPGAEIVEDATKVPGW